MPSSSSFMPSRPSSTLTNDCVAIAPTPLFACGTIAPTHGTAVHTATPKEALFGSRAMMLNVIGPASSHSLALEATNPRRSATLLRRPRLPPRHPIHDPQHRLDEHRVPRLRFAVDHVV